MATSEISDLAAGPNAEHGNSTNTKQISWRICRSLDACKIHGFDNELMLVRNLFQGKEDNDGFKAIGIVGVLGIGKSAICRKLLETSDIKTDYFPRIWISASRRFTDGQDPKVALVKRILLCLGFEEEKLKSISRNQNLNDLLYVLHLQLTGKRYLIVLDDVRESENKESDNWLKNLNDHPPDRSESHLADGLPKTGGGRVIVTSRSSAFSNQSESRLADGLPKTGGGRVIVTSRSSELAKAMVGEENIHQLIPFTDPESFWKIYEQEVKNGGSESCCDAELKPELLEKCRGLPLVAKMLGEIKVRDEA